MTIRSSIKKNASLDSYTYFPYHGYLNAIHCSVGTQIDWLRTNKLIVIGNVFVNVSGSKTKKSATRIAGSYSGSKEFVSHFLSVISFDLSLKGFHKDNKRLQRIFDEFAHEYTRMMMDVPQA